MGKVIDAVPKIQRKRLEELHIQRHLDMARLGNQYSCVHPDIVKIDCEIIRLIQEMDCYHDWLDTRLLPPGPVKEENKDDST